MAAGQVAGAAAASGAARPCGSSTVRWQVSGSRAPTCAIDEGAVRWLRRHG
jgi:hypothetical protein